MNNKQPAYSFVNPKNGKPLIKQWNYFTNILKAAKGESDKRFFFWAGSVNSSKTYTNLLSILFLAKEYKQCKIHVVRQSMPTLIQTTIESAAKLFNGLGHWHKDKSNFHFAMDNGSKIYFFSENFDSDKDLDRFKGLETNIFLLEELPELQYETFEKCKERVGRWKVPGLEMPKPLILATMNPTHIKWVRDLVLHPYQNGTVDNDTYIQFASTMDNPFITDDELKMYQKMDSLKYRQYILSDWNVFDNVKAWAYCFNKQKHVGTVELDKNSEIVISFDFNVNPITAIIAHVDTKTKKLHVVKEFKLDNSDIYKLCAAIKEYIKDSKGYRYVVGDSTGQSRHVSLPQGATLYTIILKELNLIPASLHKLSKKNMKLIDSQAIVNSVLEKYNVKIDSSCESLINDLLSVESLDGGKIDKKDGRLTHLLDTFRYICNSFFASDFLM